MPNSGRPRANTGPGPGTPPIAQLSVVVDRQIRPDDKNHCGGKENGYRKIVDVDTPEPVSPGCTIGKNSQAVPSNEWSSQTATSLPPVPLIPKCEGHLGPGAPPERR